jgi:formylglycine-generating enzyme required for sulfatase activity
VVRVSWEDAQAFCRWLSKKEGKTYRLPTDEEWSKAVGIAQKEEKKATLQEKNGKVEGEYTWGTDWPPPKGAGNFCDESRNVKAPNVKYPKYLEGYDDGFPTTAPVMSFKPNEFGLYDLGGNVREWVEDWYNSEQTARGVRGASWYLLTGLDLRSSYRVGIRPSDRNPSGGFRCVVLPASSPPTLN